MPAKEEVGSLQIGDFHRTRTGGNGVNWAEVAGRIDAFLSKHRTQMERAGATQLSLQYGEFCTVAGLKGTENANSFRAQVQKGLDASPVGQDGGSVILLHLAGSKAPDYAPTPQTRIFFGYMSRSDRIQKQQARAAKKAAGTVESA
jgi:hypothetical protein